MKLLKIPSSLSHVPDQIRKNAAEHDITIHDDWTDLDLVNLWNAILHDRLLTVASLGMSPEEALDDNLFDPKK